MGNIESVDGQSEMMKHHIMPLKVPMPDPNELEEKFAIVLVSFASTFFPPHPISFFIISPPIRKKSATLCFYLNFRCVMLHGDNKKQINQKKKVTTALCFDGFSRPLDVMPVHYSPSQRIGPVPLSRPPHSLAAAPLQALSCGSFVCHKVRQLSVWPRQRGGGMGWRGGDGGGAVLLLV